MAISCRKSSGLYAWPSPTPVGHKDDNSWRSTRLGLVFRSLLEAESHVSSERNRQTTDEPWECRPARRTWRLFRPDRRVPGPNATSTSPKSTSTARREVHSMRLGESGAKRKGRDISSAHNDRDRSQQQHHLGIARTGAFRCSIPREFLMMSPLDVPARFRKPAAVTGNTPTGDRLAAVIVRRQSIACPPGNRQVISRRHLSRPHLQVSLVEFACLIGRSGRQLKQFSGARIGVPLKRGYVA